MVANSTSAANRPKIDPRIRQRRIEVKRDEGRRRLRVILACVTVASLAGVGVAATRSALLDVDHVTVRGASRTAPADVVAAAGLNRRRFMIDVDGQSIARRVDRLPWVAATTVSRRWPGTVTLTVRERTAIAVLAGPQNTFSLVDATGRVLQGSAQPQPGLVVIAGGEPAPAPGQLAGPAARAAVEVAAAIPSDLRGRVSGLSLVAGGEVELRLSGSGGPTVRFGSAEDVPAKMTALSTLVAKANLTGATVIDVRVPAAPVLTRAASSR